MKPGSVIVDVEMYVVKFYNRIAQPANPAQSICDIPPPALEFISHLDYEELIKPFVVEDVKRGWGGRGISQKYGVREWFGRAQGIRIGKLVNSKKRKGRAKAPTHK